MLCAVCCGSWIVSPAYLGACRKAGHFVNEEGFLLRDTVCESAFARKRNLSGYSLAAAAERARSQGPLLRGVSVYCFPCAAEQRDLHLLVAAAGGTLLSR